MRIPKLKDFLCEMAFDRRRLLDKISALEPVINQHLVKIIYWRDAQNYKKHLKDLDGWLFTIGRYELKGKKGRLSSEEYFDLLFQEPFTSSTSKEDVEDFRKYIYNNPAFDGYFDLQVISTPGAALKEIEQFHSWTSRKLTEGDNIRLATRYFKEKER